MSASGTPGGRPAGHRRPPRRGSRTGRGRAPVRPRTKPRISPGVRSRSAACTNCRDAAQPSVRAVDIGQDVGLERPAVRLAEQPRGLDPRRTAGRRVVSSATSPIARSFAIGMPGDRRLAKTIVRRSGARSTSSRTISCDVWRVVDEVEVVEDQDGAVRRDRLHLAHEDVDDGVTRRATQALVGEHRCRVRRERGVCFAAGRHQMVEDRDPVPVVLVEPIPQRPQPGPTGEVRQQRRLAVSGVGEDQDDPVVDLGREPVQQAMTGQRLLRAAAEAGPSRTGSESRSRRHGGLRWPVRRRSLAAPTATGDGERSPDGWVRGCANDTERSRRVSTEESGSAMAPS